RTDHQWHQKMDQAEESRGTQPRSASDALLFEVAERTVAEGAAARVMEKAYMKASANGTLPANARQVMYAARGEIQALTGKPLNDQYFTQTLLPNYIKENELSWD